MAHPLEKGQHLAWKELHSGFGKKSNQVAGQSRGKERITNGECPLQPGWEPEEHWPPLRIRSDCPEPQTRLTQLECAQAAM